MLVLENLYQWIVYDFRRLNYSLAIHLPKVLIVYDTETGNTEKMAESVLEGVEEAGVDCVLRKVEDCTLDDMKSAEGIILGPLLISETCRNR